MADMDETFVQPLAVPKLPARFYFRFQAPIRTRPEDLEDRDKCDGLYRQTKVSCALCPRSKQWPVWSSSGWSTI